MPPSFRTKIPGSLLGDVHYTSKNEGRSVAPSGGGPVARGGKGQLALSGVAGKKIIGCVEFTKSTL